MARMSLFEYIQFKLAHHAIVKQVEKYERCVLKVHAQQSRVYAMIDRYNDRYPDFQIKTKRGATNG